MTDYLSCEPNLGNFTKSLLSIGYTHYTAILDIIDNSIAAGSTKIWIDYDTSGSKQSMVISDNGFGMSDSELFEAMSEVAKSGQGPAIQTPSIGCSIKWIGE